MSLKIEGGQAMSQVAVMERLGILRKDLEGLSGEEIDVLFELLTTAQPEDLGLLGGDMYDREMVDMETFLTDEYYLGNIGKTLYNCWWEDLIELFSGDYHEAVISGAIGIGKNTFASIALCRMVYEMSCLKDPQSMFGLEKGSEIAFCCISVNERLAKHAVFGGIKTKIMSSRYFMEQFPYKPTLTELRFPNNIWVAASSSAMSSALSLNTFGGILDEVNFMPQTPPRVAKIRYGSKRRERVSHAETLYQMLLRRMKSRYGKSGKIPGVLLMISSKSHTDSFTEKRIRSAADDPHVFVRERSLWDAKPKGQYSADVFHVFVGNERVQSKMLYTNDERKEALYLIESNVDYADCQVIHVPMDFRRDFEQDLDSSLQDLAGVATVSISPFIQRREAVYYAVDETREHPMSVPTWNPRQPANIDWTKLTKRYRSRDHQGFTSEYEGPIINPQALRHVHIDTSLNHDCTGICIGHIADYTKVQRRDEEGNTFMEDAPVFVIDFMLRIVPPPGEDIIMADIRTMLYLFMDHGFQFGLVTTDSYQSAEMRQYIEAQRGIDTKLLSVDKTPDPYYNLRSAIYERRIHYYAYEPFLYEIQRLVHNKVQNKIDHPEEGSKDVADAVAGVVHSLVEDGSSVPIPMRLGISEYDEPAGKDEWIKRDLGIGEKPIQTGGYSGQIDHDFFFPVVG